MMLIDCAPFTSVLTVIAQVAADAFIVPVRPTYLALAGALGWERCSRT
ncbi:MAG: AAA family ATPase [Bacteroidetes bacterium]|nr:AAA family ATPase [Bacteroidota bacterium]